MRDDDWGQNDADTRTAVAFLLLMLACAALIGVILGYLLGSGWL